jgi:hypothetical protein
LKLLPREREKKGERKKKTKKEKETKFSSLPGSFPWEWIKKKQPSHLLRICFVLSQRLQMDESSVADGGRRPSDKSQADGQCKISAKSSS